MKLYCLTCSILDGVIFKKYFKMLNIFKKVFIVVGKNVKYFRDVLEAVGLHISVVFYWGPRPFSLGS